MTLNASIFNQIVADARAKAADNPACLRAIDRAVEALRTRAWSFDSRSGVLTICGSGPELYTANGSCQCRAYTEFKHALCVHRVACRLLTRYFEAIAV